MLLMKIVVLLVVLNIIFIMVVFGSVSMLVIVFSVGLMIRYSVIMVSIWLICCYGVCGFSG